MTTATQSAAADAFTHELERLHPDQGEPATADRDGHRPHIATIESAPQHPHAMDAALTETAAMISSLSLQLQSRFEQAPRSWEDDDNPDWQLTQAALTRLLASDAYLRLAESHTLAMGAADAPAKPAGQERPENQATRMRGCRLVLLEAALNALESMKHDTATLVPATAHAVSRIANSRREEGQPWRHGGTRAAQSLVDAAQETLRPAITHLHRRAAALRSPRGR